MTDNNTGRYCRSCRWYYRMEDGKIGKCTEASRCTYCFIPDYRMDAQSCVLWKPKTGLTVSTGTN